MKRAKDMPTLDPPEDPLITTIYIAGLIDDRSRSVLDPVTETDLRDHFYQVQKDKDQVSTRTLGVDFIKLGAQRKS